MFRLLYAVDETGDDGDDDCGDGGDDDDDGGDGWWYGWYEGVLCKGHCIFNIHCAPNIQPSNFSW